MKLVHYSGSSSQVAKYIKEAQEKDSTLMVDLTGDAALESLYKNYISICAPLSDTSPEISLSEQVLFAIDSCTCVNTLPSIFINDCHLFRMDALKDLSLEILIQTDSEVSLFFNDPLAKEFLVFACSTDEVAVEIIQKHLKKRNPKPLLVVAEENIAQQLRKNFSHELSALNEEYERSGKPNVFAQGRAVGLKVFNICSKEEFKKLDSRIVANADIVRVPYEQSPKNKNI